MLKKYEDACRKANLSEAEIHELRKMFNQDYSRNYRRKKAKAECGIYMESLSSVYGSSPDEPTKMRDVPDERIDIEAEVIHKIDLEALHTHLQLLPEEDRIFILECFDDEITFMDLVRKYGIPRTTLRRRMERIIRELRKKMM